MNALILTLKLDQASFELFDRLRAQHFPPARNFLRAHVTMFHALPSQHLDAIMSTLQETAAETPILNLNFTAPRFLGKGVAINLYCSELIALRAKLRLQWSEWLTAQDNQINFRPHVTVQNKVLPEIARQLFEKLKTEWQPLTGQGEGWQLWEYLNGPWRLIETFEFKQSRN